MSKVFVDSNLLIYLASGITEKAEKVDKLIRQGDEILISLQVLNEFAAVCFKKNLLSFDEIRSYVNEFNLYFKVVDVDFKNIVGSFEIKKRYKYSWFDSLIIATALLNNCSVLYSEDMQHKQKIEKLTIINPLK